jgi:hypothetical protein
VQGFVGLDPAAPVTVGKSIRLGVDDASLDVPQVVVATIAMAGDDAGMRQLS